MSVSVVKEEYDPWVAGYVLGKYQQYNGWPAENQLSEWLEGFKVGTTEVGEFQVWKQRLGEYVEGREGVPEYLSILGIQT